MFFLYNQVTLNKKDIPMIIDIHAHIYPEKIAEKATLAVSHFYEEAPMAFKGISDKLIESGSKIGVEKYVVHSVSTKPEQVESINNFIISETQKHPEFIGFGTMHQDYKDFEQELKPEFSDNVLLSVQPNNL